MSLGWPRSGHAGRRSRDEVSGGEGAALLLAEYATLREEVFRAQGYAQGNVRWTMTTYGALFSIGLLSISTSGGSLVDSLPAGLAAITDSEATFVPVLLYVLLALFGLVIPALVWIGAWMWLGELRRAERAASYLRGLEQQIAADLPRRERASIEPLRWERFMLLHRGSGSAWGMRESASLAVGAMFLAATVLSLALFLYLMVQLAQNPTAGALFLSAAAALEIAGIWVTWHIHRGLNRLSSSAPDIPASPVVTLTPQEAAERRGRRRRR